MIFNSKSIGGEFKRKNNGFAIPYFLQKSQPFFLFKELLYEKQMIR